MAIDHSIKYIFALSGRSSYFKQPVDSPIHEGLKVTIIIDFN